MQDGWQELKGKVCFCLSKTAGYQTSMNKTGLKKVPFLEFLGKVLGISFVFPGFWMYYGSV